MPKKINKRVFIQVSKSCLEIAPIINDALLKKSDQFNNELAQIKNIKSQTYAFELDNKIADYLYSTYEYLELTDDSKIVGINNNERVALFDASDTKIHLEI